ncbi:MAG: response regulator [Deltaproteobacteria bacterium]|nr:response regulator [Deltaproteobacteria bacterium]
MDRPTVLVVDDEPDVRDNIALVLEESGYQVISAANGREALRLLEGPGPLPSMILLDMIMPVMDGWHFRAKQLENSRIASIPIVIFTSWAVPRDTPASLKAAGFLPKPLRMDHLVKAVADVTGTAPTSR